MTVSRTKKPLILLGALFLSGCGGSSDSGDSNSNDASDDLPQVDSQQEASKQYNKVVADVVEAGEGVDEAHQSVRAISNDMSFEEVDSRVNRFLDAVAEYDAALQVMSNSSAKLEATAANTLTASARAPSMRVIHVDAGTPVRSQGLANDIIGFVPGLSDVANIFGLGEMVGEAKDKAEELGPEVESGNIDSEQYGNLVTSELGNVFTTGAGLIVSGIAATAATATASAVGVTVLPATIVGGLAGGTTSLVYNYVFTGGETENGECVDDCIVATGKTNEKGQAFIPEGVSGDLVVTRSDNHPVSFSDFEIDETEANTIIDKDDTPINEPIEERVTVTPEPPPETVKTCADIASLRPNFENLGSGDLRMTVSTIPEVAGCDLKLTQGRIFSEAQNFTLDDERFKGETTLSIPVPAFGDFSVALTLEALASDARLTFSRKFEQDEVAIISLEPVNPDFWLKTGESIPIDYVAIKGTFVDGKSVIFFDSDDPAIERQFLGGAGSVSPEGIFESGEPGTANFRIEYRDPNNSDSTASLNYTIRVEADEEDSDGGEDVGDGNEDVGDGTVVVGEFNRLGPRRCEAFTRIPDFGDATLQDQLEGLVEGCNFQDNCEVVPSCPTDWVASCEGRSTNGEGIKSDYLYLNDAGDELRDSFNIRSEEDICIGAGGTFTVR